MKDLTLSPLPLISGARLAGQPVAYRGEQTLTWAEFQSHVGGMHAELSSRRESSWVLCCEDAFFFLCGLVAVLCSGKCAIIPPNFQPGTLASFEGKTDGWIVDRTGSDVGDPPGICLPVEAMQSGRAVALTVAESAVIDLYTSGTTGEPKRVRKHPDQLTAEVEILEMLWGKPLGAAPIVSTVPHHHIYGLLFRLLWPFYAGRPFDVIPASGPDEIYRRLRKFGRAGVVSSPAQLNRWPDLIDLAMLAPHAVSIFSSGGPLSANAAEAHRRALGSAPIEIYGSSETGGIGWRMQSDTPDADAWTPSPRVEVSIGTDNTLQVRSPFVGGDAWFAMSDAAQLLADGRFRLLGRLDRVVKIEEKRLSLPELEQRLSQHPWVAEAGVVLLEGARRVLGAVVVLTTQGAEQLARNGKHKTSGELKTFLAQYYEPALLPRRWRFVPSLPHNDRSKVTAAALAEMFVA